MDGHPIDGRSAMDRRNFLRAGLGAGAGFAAGAAFVPAAAAGDADPGAGAGEAGSGAPRPVDVPAFEFEEAKIAELQRRMESGSLTARALAAAYFARIDALDRNGPHVNAVIETNPDALALADALDAERKATGPRGPLHGIPVLVKDNIDTADRMKTSAGSLALAGSVAARDAFVVERLRAAGAVLLGKTNLSEWANFRSTRSTSGWSGRGGQTRNPYALDRNPCGSSSGTGAGISANFAAAGVGTETDGSIVCPSTMCGLVGLKPTVGLVSRAGIVPISATQDTAGPMARTVTDAALLLGALAGQDARDAATLKAKGRGLTDYGPFLDGATLKGARLGVARKLFNAGPHVDGLMTEALAALKSEGAVLVDPADIPNLGKYDDAELQVMLYEFKDGLEKYLEALGPDAPHRTLADLIRWNEDNREREMPYFGQELFEQAVKKGRLTAPEYRAALALCRRLSRAEGLDAVLQKHRLDAVLAPTGGPAWVTDLVNGDHFTGGSSSPCAVAGYPAITVPAGFVFGLPVGLTFMGPAWSEGRLLRLAFAFERATKARKPPRFLPTLPL